VIAGDDIDRHPRSKPVTKRRKHRSMTCCNAVESDYRRFSCLFSGGIFCVHGPYPGEVKDIAEKQESMVFPGCRCSFPQVIQPSSECEIVAERFGGFMSSPTGIATGCEVKIADYGDGRGAIRHYVAFPRILVNNSTIYYSMIYSHLTSLSKRTSRYG
jgi:hypothetical protein